MKAIVLGATGFIGSHIVRALIEEEIDVRIFRRSSSPHLALEGLKVEESIGDLNDLNSLKKAMKGCALLFHVAGYYPLYSFEREKQKGMALRQMKNVLEAAQKAEVKKVIYTSSMSTIGRSRDGLANEDTPYDPRVFRGLYYEIKYLLEQEALEASRNGLPIVVVNPTGVFGDFDVKPTSGTLVVAVAKQQVPLIFNAKMNAVDARDVARGEIAAMKLGKIGRRYLLGGHNSTVWEVSHLIARLAKVKPPRAKLPLFAGEVASTLSEVVGKYILHQEKPLFPKVGMDFLKYGMHYDTSRAKNELGLKTTPLDETFEREISWFRKHRYI